jgi:hypothetical protein
MKREPLRERNRRRELDLPNKHIGNTGLSSGGD